jgi:surface protein
MFDMAKSFNQDISGWKVSKVKNMRKLFFRAKKFNQDISGWDVSSVTDMDYMFFSAFDFDQTYTNSWTLSDKKTLMFGGNSDVYKKVDEYINDKDNAIQKYGQINTWDVSSETNMVYLFGYYDFNEDISNWDVSNVTDMTFMFYKSSSFNQDIEIWDVSNVKSMESMFNKATNFNKSLRRWKVSSDCDISDMFKESPLRSGLENGFKHNVLIQFGIMPGSYYYNSFMSQSLDDFFTLFKTYGVTLTYNDYTNYVRAYFNKSNNKPVINDFELKLLKNKSGKITFNATDVDSDTFTYSVKNDPSNGTVSISGNELNYTPTTDFVGSDIITCQVNDGFDNVEFKVTINIKAKVETTSSIDSQPGKIIFNTTSDVSGKQEISITIDGSTTKSDISNGQYIQNIPSGKGKGGSYTITTYDTLGDVLETKTVRFTYYNQ